MDGFELASKVVPSALDFLGKLAWPGVVLYVLTKQKGAVGGLFARLEELQIGSAKAKFGKLVDKLAEKVAALEAAPVHTHRRPPVAGTSVAPAPSAAQRELAVEPRATAGATASGAQLAGAGHTNSTGAATLTVGDKLPELPPDLPNVWRSRFSASDERLRASVLIVKAWDAFAESLRELAHQANVSYVDSDMAKVLADRFWHRSVISLESLSVVREMSDLYDQIAHSKLEPTKEAADSFAESCRKTLARITMEFSAHQSRMKELDDAYLTSFLKSTQPKPIDPAQ